mgnify:CR=1 FL=1
MGFNVLCTAKLGIWSLARPITINWRRGSTNHNRLVDEYEGDAPTDSVRGNASEHVDPLCTDIAESNVLSLSRPIYYRMDTW